MLKKAIEILENMKTSSEEIRNFRLGIGFPLSFPFVHSDFFFSCLTMERPEFIPLRAENGSIEQLRNGLVVQAQEIGCSHLIMMDCDMIYHPRTITQLISHNLPVVGARCYRRYPPFDPLLLQGDPLIGYESIDKWEDDELVEVDATGTGCLLFDMQVFSFLPPPWFKQRDNPNEAIGGVIGEDIGFSWDLRQAGYKIYVDTSVSADHLTMMRVNDATYRLYKAMKTKQREKALSQALIGPEECLSVAPGGK